MRSHPCSPSDADVAVAALPDWVEHARRATLTRLAGVAARAVRARAALVCVDAGGTQRLLAHAGLPPDADALAGALDELCSPLLAQERGGVVRVAEALGWRAVPALGDERIAALAGVPVRSGGLAVGVLAVLDTVPRDWTPDELDDLRGLADAVSAELDRARVEARTAALASRLMRSEAKYARLVEGSFAAVYITDVEGRFVELNDTAEVVLGRSRTDVLGCGFRDFVAPEDLVLADRMFRQRIAGSADRGEVELRVVRPTGELRLVQISAAPVVEEGRIVGTHGVARDITDDRAREMQFRRAERMASVGPLLSGVCHELNNPLTSIKSFAELLLLDERSAEDREAMEIVQREAHRAAKIVTDLRVVARQSQESSSDRCAVDSNEVVRAIVREWTPRLEAASVELQCDLAADLPTLWMSKAQIEQVVQQLIANAVQAMQSQAGARRLVLRSYAGGLGVVLQVEDTGPGIPRQHIDRIFDPFWTTRQAGEGTGLGLSLVNGIVTDHGGRIRVDSVAGKGARFVVELPVAGEPTVRPGDCDAEASASRSLNILVVDDEAAIRYSLTRYMERRGHVVHGAEDGAAALAMLDAAEVPYDLIVADLRMPGLHGGALLERLRARGEGLEERLIFISGDTDGSDLPGGIREGSIPMVEKPFELAEIAQVIEVQASIAAMR